MILGVLRKCDAGHHLQNKLYNVDHISVQGTGCGCSDYGLSQDREEVGSPRKTSSASLITLKPLTVSVTKNCGKSLKRWEYQNTLPVS